MKDQFLYVILDNQGGCRRVDDAPEKTRLSDLLAEGWRPVRETTFGDGRVLILLEREAEGKFGFGFNPG